MNELSTDKFEITGNYSGKVAYGLGVVSDYMYSSEANIKAGLIKSGFHFTQDSQGGDCFKFINDLTTSTEAMVAADSSKVIIAFRGSQEDDDWTTNSMALLTDSGVGGKVHFGMLQGFLNVWDHISDAIRHFNAATKPAFFTGHSLGGALATLAAIYYNREFNRFPAGTYIYGSPRVGNNEFASTYNTQLKRTTFRYINDLDIVTSLPPEKLGYKHVGYPCYFSDSGQLSTTLPDSASLTNMALQWFDRDIKSELTDDHKMSYYRSNLHVNINTKITFK